MSNFLLAKNATVLFQGDSITDGGRSRNEDLNHVMGHGYAYLVAARLGADHPELGLRFLNRGCSGNRVVDLYGRWREDALNLKPDVISILIGVNDVGSEFKRNAGVPTAKERRNESVNWINLIATPVMALTAITLNLASVVHAAEPAPAAPVALKLAPILSDHMVLQREMDAPAWGTANPGEIHRLGRELGVAAGLPHVQVHGTTQATDRRRWRAWTEAR